MPAREFRSSWTREPLVARFPDGREYAFPAAIEAKPMLEIMRRFASVASVEDLPNDAMLELGAVVAGPEGLAWLEEHCTFDELMAVLGWLFEEHQVSVSPAAPEDEARPTLASTTS